MTIGQPLGRTLPMPACQVKQSKPCYYRLLGVTDAADENDLKKAFRSLAKTHHPDKIAGGSPEAFVAIKEVQYNLDIVASR